MILAGDVGGTKTLVGLFHFGAKRPVAVDVKSFPTLDFSGLSAIVDEFFKQRGSPPRMEVACFGVAGPVIEQTAEMTNVPWTVSAADISSRYKLQRVRLLNDLEAMAYAVPVLDRDELETLQQGRRRHGANAALIAAGTGLGEATLHNISGRFRPISSEGGHADFAARTDRELDLVRYLRDRLGRVNLENVVSGPGLVHLYRFVHGGEPCDVVGPLVDTAEGPAVVSRAGMEKWCPRCTEAVEMFVSAYGAAAGNLALRAVATGGLYLGGGIAPQMLPLLKSPLFLDAFNDKAPMTDLMRSIPIQVILNAQAALLGAAVFANEMI
ncbi:MAG: glucokinase [Acidobacteriota bacterium]